MIQWYTSRKQKKTRGRLTIHAARYNTPCSLPFPARYFRACAHAVTYLLSTASTIARPFVPSVRANNFPASDYRPYSFIVSSSHSGAGASILEKTFRIRCYSTVLTVSLLSTIYKIFQDEDSISGSENFNLRNSREKNSPFLVRNGTISRHIRDIKIENNTCLVEATRVKAG